MLMHIDLLIAKHRASSDNVFSPKARSQASLAYYSTETIFSALSGFRDPGSSGMPMSRKLSSMRSCAASWRLNTASDSCDLQPQYLQALWVSLKGILGVTYSFCNRVEVPSHRCPLDTVQAKSRFRRPTNIPGIPLLATPASLVRMLQASSVLSIGGLLIFGTLSSIASKVVYQTEGETYDGSVKEFKKPCAFPQLVILISLKPIPSSL